MADLIEIERVALSPLAREALTPAMARLEIDWYTFDVVVKNRSESPLYVVRELCRIRYDAGERLLLLELTEHGGPESSALVERPVPSYAVLEPHGHATLTNRLSSPITWVEPSPERLWRPIHVRIPDDVDTLECVVGYTTERPAWPPDDTAVAVPERLPEWTDASARTPLVG